MITIQNLASSFSSFSLSLRSHAAAVTSSSNLLYRLSAARRPVCPSLPPPSPSLPLSIVLYIFYREKAGALAVYMSLFRR